MIAVCDNGNFLAREKRRNVVGKFFTYLLDNMVHSCICTVKAEIIDKCVGISKLLMRFNEGHLEAGPCFVCFRTPDPFANIAPEDPIFR